MLHAFGVGEVPISISGDPGQPAACVTPSGTSGSVSHALASPGPGTVLGVRGPFGTGWEVGSGRGGDVVFVAGGIGLAPLRPAILEICAARGDYRRVAVLYGARTPEDILFSEELRAWSSDHDIAVEVTVDSGQHAWRGNVGLVTQLDRSGRRSTPTRTLALVCGPEVMMRHSAAALGRPWRASCRVRLSMERNMKCGVGSVRSLPAARVLPAAWTARCSPTTCSNLSWPERSSRDDDHRKPRRRHRAGAHRSWRCGSSRRATAAS